MVTGDFFDLLRTFGSWVGLLLTAWVCSSTPGLSFSTVWVCAPATKYIQWGEQVLSAPCLALAAGSGILGVSSLFPESCSGFAKKIYIPPVHSSSNSPCPGNFLSNCCCLMPTLPLSRGRVRPQSIEWTNKLRGFPSCPMSPGGLGGLASL